MLLLYSATRLFTGEKTPATWDFKDRMFSRTQNQWLSKRMKKRSGGKKVEKEKKSLILVTFHHTKTSDMLGVKSGFKK